MKYIFISLMLMTGYVVHAQNSLSGKVVSAKDSATIPGANIYIPDLKIGVSTNKDGTYDLQNIPEGTYVVKARSVGFALMTKMITVSGDTKLNFALLTSENELQEVVVTGNSIATEAQSNATPIAEVPHSDLEQNASTNIIDALSKVPGVSGITDGQSISKPVIRGLGYNRVVTLNDGVRQEGQQWGDEFGIEVDPNSVYRVEILKGPGSLAYGSDAISGVVNLIPEKPMPEGQIKGDVMYNYQSNNGLNNNMLHFAGTKKGISWSARVTNIMAHAYKNKYDGYVLNSQFSNFAYEGTVGLHRKWGYSQLHYSFFNLKTGIVEGERDSASGKFTRAVLVDGEPVDEIATNQELRSYTPFLINQNVKHSKAVWDNSIAIGKSRILARAAFQQNSRQEYNDPTIPNISNIFYLLNTLNYDLRYVSPDMHNFNVSVGVNGMDQNSQNKGTLLLIPEYNLFDIGGFAIANKKIKGLTISGGIRYDIRKFQGHDDYIDSVGNELTASDPNAIHRFTAYNSDFNGVSGSFGAAYNITKDFYVKANAARGFRAPNVAETGSNGIHDGTVVYEIGDPTLKPENSLQYDLAIGVDSKDVTAEIDAFNNNIDHFIYPSHLYTANGADSVNSSTPGFEDAPVFKYTQGDAVLTGGEAVLDIHPSGLEWLDLYTAYSTVDAHLKNEPDSLKYLPFIPPAHLTSNLTLTADKIGKYFANTYFRFGMFYSFEQSHVYQQSAVYMDLSSYELAASKAPTAAYLLLNAGVGSDIMKGDRKICSVYLSVNNLADVAYMDYMSRFKYYPVNNAKSHRVGVYNMGRNLSVKLIVPVDFTKAR